MKKLLFCCYLFILGFSPSFDLETISQSVIKIAEPSALSYSLDRQSLLTVSDQDGAIYQIDFSGKIQKKIQTGLRDLEGIAAHPDLSGYCLVEERIRKVSCFDHENRLTKSKIIRFLKANNAGFEGITYNTLNKHLYVVNEKSPTIILELDLNLNLLKTVEFNHLLDLSDIYYEESENKFYLLSHESKKIISTDHLFNVESHFSLSNVIQAEGLVVDPLNKMIYVVSDKDSKFISFKMP